ncbi:hypothetical protein NTH_03628 [Nitratireductor thuwali]|uniref:Metal-binding protein n=2 Tax=Nitratireductor thuwali TaxID=2267699 RepID=A0ABY5MR89_9HYPH|nr:hypothetical protein NTH_03628 [Nitratireductor thuwali]
MMNPTDAKSPVSYPFRVSRLARKGTDLTITADADQRAGLAKAHGLLSVERFDAEIAVRPWKADGVRVKGEVFADIVQECVVTLDPLPARIAQDFEALFIPEDSRLARQEWRDGEIVIEAEGADLPEPFSGDTIDLGAVAEEFFALAIDPYPRKKGTEIASKAESATDEKKVGPLYEGLKKLRGEG